jgi:hypothetical protein
MKLLSETSANVHGRSRTILPTIVVGEAVGGRI